MQVVESVPEGLRLERPSRCPDDCYEIMKLCFEHNLNERPSFVDIHARLAPMDLRKKETLADTLRNPTLTSEEAIIQNRLDVHPHGPLLYAGANRATMATYNQINIADAIPLATFAGVGKKKFGRSRGNTAASNTESSSMHREDSIDTEALRPSAALKHVTPSPILSHHSRPNMIPSSRQVQFSLLDIDSQSSSDGPVLSLSSPLGAKQLISHERTRPSTEDLRALSSNLSQKRCYSDENGIDPCCVSDNPYKNEIPTSIKRAHSSILVLRTVPEDGFPEPKIGQITTSQPQAVPFADHQKDLAQTDMDIFSKDNLEDTILPVQSPQTKVPFEFLSNTPLFIDDTGTPSSVAFVAQSAADNFSRGLTSKSEHPTSEYLHYTSSSHLSTAISRQILHHAPIVDYPQPSPLLTQSSHHQVPRNSSPSNFGTDARASIGTLTSIEPLFTNSRARSSKSNYAHVPRNTSSPIPKDLDVTLSPALAFASSHDASKGNYNHVARRSTTRPDILSKDEASIPHVFDLAFNQISLHPLPSAQNTTLVDDPGLNGFICKFRHSFIRSNKTTKR